MNRPPLVAMPKGPGYILRQYCTYKVTLDLGKGRFFTQVFLGLYIHKIKLGMFSFIISHLKSNKVMFHCKFHFDFMFDEYVVKTLHYSAMETIIIMTYRRQVWKY